MIDDLAVVLAPPCEHRSQGDPLREALKAIEPDALTPWGALAVLYELKEKAKP